MTSTPMDDRLSFTALTPTESGSIIEVHEQSAALHLAIVDVASVSNLSAEWDGPGVYILLDRHLSDGTWGAYVGKTTAGIQARLKQHASKKDHWYRAIFVRRDTSYGFTSAHAAWLEGRLYDLLRDAENTKLHNSVRPTDDSVAAYELPMLESAVEPVAQLLRLIGHDVATAQDHDAMRLDGRKKDFHGVELKDLIRTGWLKGNEKLVSTIGTVLATAQIHPDGRIEYGGEFFNTPSGAAAAARGGETNGWSMWAIETPTGRVRLATIRSNYQDSLNTSH